MEDSNIVSTVYFILLKGWILEPWRSFIFSCSTFCERKYLQYNLLQPKMQIEKLNLMAHIPSQPWRCTMYNVHVIQPKQRTARVNNGPFPLSQADQVSIWIQCASYRRKQTQELQDCSPCVGHHGEMWGKTFHRNNYKLQDASFTDADTGGMRVSGRSPLSLSGGRRIPRSKKAPFVPFFEKRQYIIKKGAQFIPFFLRNISIKSGKINLTR